MKEHFVPNASMQKGRASRGIDDITFVRFEVALDVFNKVVESYVEGPPPMVEAADKAPYAPTQIRCAADRIH